jgi:MFS family permease
MEGNLTILTIRQVIGMFIRRMVLTYSSLFILAVGGDSSQIGIVNSLMPLAGLLMFPVSGYLADRTSRVKLIALADFLSALTMLCYIFARSWEWIAVGAFLQGFMVFSFPPTSAILADSLDPSNRSVGIAIMTTMANAVAIFSPYIAAIITEIYGVDLGMRILYGLLGLQFLLSSILVYMRLEETTKPDAYESMPSLVNILRQSYSGIPELWGSMNRNVKALSFVVLMGFIANGVSSPFWVVYVTEVIELSNIEWGLILLYETVLKVLLTIPSGVIADRVGRTKTLMGSVVIGLIALPSIIFVDGFTGALLVRLGTAVAGALFMPSCTALMADYVPRSQRGRVMAAIGRGSVLVGATGGGTGGPGMGYLFTIPVIISSLVGGLLYVLEPAFPWIVVAVTCMAQVLVVTFYIKEPTSKEI